MSIDFKKSQLIELVFGGLKEHIFQKRQPIIQEALIIEYTVYYAAKSGALQLSDSTPSIGTLTREIGAATRLLVREIFGIQ